MLHDVPVLHVRAHASCSRCGALLVKFVPDGLERTLAWFLAAACLYAIANALPLVALEAQGSTTSTTLFGTVRALESTGMWEVATLVFVTTMLMPGLEIAAMLYLLVPVAIGHVPAALPQVFRAVHAVKPWVMVEVFMLGVLVALAKLQHIATVVPGLALGSFAVLMVALAAGSAAFHGSALWRRLDAMHRVVPA